MAVKLLALRTDRTSLPRNIIIFMFLVLVSVRGWVNRLCGLVVRVPAYRSRGPGSIPSATGFSEK
jgi:hypothetical protein